MGYAYKRPRPRRRPLKARRRRPVRRFFFGTPQSVTITGSGGLVLGGTGNTSASVYGPGAAGRVAPARSRQIGVS